MAAFCRNWLRLSLIVGIAVQIAAWQPARAQSIGDMIYPEKSIDENIDHLQRVLQDLNNSLGKTVDNAILKALERALIAIQSARVAYSGSLRETVDAVGRERASLLYQLADQVVELNKSLDSKVNKLSESEQRVTHTMEEIMRSSQAPWVLSFEPHLYRPDRGGPLTFVISGQNLSNPAVRLVIGTTELRPFENIANELKFSVNRTLLVPDENGFATLILRAPAPDPSWFSWAPWHSSPPPSEYRVITRALGPLVGTYKVDTEVPDGNGYEIRTETIAEASPNSKEYCIYRASDEEFDIGEVRPTVIRNDVSFPPATKHLFLPFGNVNVDVPVPAHTDQGPANPATVSFNSPEQICITFNSPPPAGGSSEVDVSLRYRVRFLKTRYHPAHFEGEIAWDKDTPVLLPVQFNGFRATVDFLGAERDRQRVFTQPQQYGPLEISLDANSRTLVFRPLAVD